MSTVILILIGVAYVVLIGAFSYGFEKVPEFRASRPSPMTRFCLVVPFRNEQHALPALLASLVQLDYPSELLECLFVDDASDDTSVALIQSASLPFPVSILPNRRLTGSPKKDAIVTAIEATGMDWIITTDADCTMGANWLRTYDAFIQEKQPDFIAAPVGVKSHSEYWTALQVMEHMALQGATIGGFGIGRPFLCNGANMAYTKQFFQESYGYLGNEAIASGDDVFLLHKAVHAGKKTAFLKAKEAIVWTGLAPDFASYVQQRVRWARKSPGYRNTFARTVAVVVFFGNLFPAVALLFFVLRFSFVDPDLHTAAWFFAFKCVVDYALLTRTRRFFGVYAYHFFSGSLVYPFLSSFVAIRSMWGGYTWKGRRFRR